MYPNPSLMKLVLNPSLLFILALVVLTVNAWELARQFAGFAAFRAGFTAAEAA
jgi:hypothetical protein